MKLWLFVLMLGALCSQVLAENISTNITDTNFTIQERECEYDEFAYCKGNYTVKTFSCIDGLLVRTGRVCEEGYIDNDPDKKEGWLNRPQNIIALALIIGYAGYEIYKRI